MMHAEYLTDINKAEQELQSGYQDLEELLECCAVGSNVISADGTILQANRAELELLGYSADEYLGHQISEFHADQSATYDMLERLSQGQKLERYPVRIRAKDQSVKHVEISSNAQFRDGHFLGARCLTIDVTQATIAGQQLQRSRQLLDALPMAVYTTDAEGLITYCNQAAIDLAGRRPELYKDRWCVTWRLYYPDGRPCPPEACPMAITLRENRPIRGIELIAERPDGTRLRVLPFPTPLRNETGALDGAINVLADISDREQANQTRETLIAELNHRVKNTLATVQAIAQQTLRHSRDPDQFITEFNGRIQALARVHTLLAANAWRGIELSTLMRLRIGAARSARVGWAGPEVVLQPQMATNIALIVHELASRSERFGPLSGPSRHLWVEWSVETTNEGRILKLDWTEAGGVPRPSSQEFQSTLTEQIVRAAGGNTTAEPIDEGMRWSISFPLPADPNSVDAATSSGSVTAGRCRHTDRSVLNDKRILIIEDEPLIALELSRILTEAGMQVVGIAKTPALAQRALAAGNLSTAILDANLNGEKVDELAARLAAEKVPFVFVSGYDRESLPATFRDRPLISKPFTSQEVLDTLAVIVSGANANAAAS